MRASVVILIVILVAAVLSCRTPADTPEPQTASARATQGDMHVAQVPPPAPNPQTAPAAAEAPKGPNPIIARIREEIAGKENLPAEQVFENIQIMKGMPAGRVLAVMEHGFTPGLGVRCSFCHEPGNWASDAKDHKRIARDMWTMSMDVNKRITEITGEPSKVNCSTCHQGKPHPPGHGEDHDDR